MEDCLESILNEVRATSGHDVQVVVANNNSGAVTRDALAAFAADNHEVRLLSFDSNLGYDRNVLRLAKNIETDYVWFVGDDDIVLPGALPRLLAAIESNPGVGMVLCPPSFFSESVGERRRTPLFESDRFYDSGSRFPEDTLWASAALSSHCWKSDLLNGLGLEALSATGWVHVLALVVAAGHPDTSFAVLEPDLVAVRMGNDRWARNGNSVSIGLDHLDVIAQGQRYGCDESVYVAFRDARFRTNLTDIVSSVNAMPAHSRLALLKRMKGHFVREPRFWAADAPLLLLPEWPRRFPSRVAAKARFEWHKRRPRRSM